MGPSTQWALADTDTPVPKRVGGTQAPRMPLAHPSHDPHRDATVPGADTNPSGKRIVTARVGAAEPTHAMPKSWTGDWTNLDQLDEGQQEGGERVGRNQWEGGSSYVQSVLRQPLAAFRHPNAFALAAASRPIIHRTAPGFPPVPELTLFRARAPVGRRVW